MKARTDVKLLLLFFIYLASCSQNSEHSNAAIKEDIKSLTTSQQQLTDATYQSEDEKKALSKFIKGTEFCEKYKSITSTESGFYVTVPVDYKDLAKGETKIWAYFTSGNFNPEMPTMIYFDGGSGGNSHGSKRILKNFNELHYDQRGIGCSHPETLELYRDPDFYSNLNNAKDADEIRKFLKIDQVSLYGASYGTVVATIYASNFEAQTKAVILDGTVFSDQSNSKIIGFYLKKMYGLLQPGTQAGLKKYINSEDKLIRLWSLARVLMYNNDPFGKLKKYLTLAFPSENEINQDFADKILSPDLFQQVFFGDTIDSVEAFNNQMLNCKNAHQKQKMELSLFGPYAGLYQQFSVYQYDVDRTKECKTISAQEDAVVYSANNFPISVPVVYFQGNLDAATYASGAIQHYKQVPTKQKQLLIAVNGGHCPGMAALQSQKSDVIELVESALQGQIVTAEQLKKLNLTESEVHWVYTSQ